MTLEEITHAVLAVSPQLVDAREAAALVESCGVSDRIASSDFGMPDTFAVGEYVHRRSRTDLAVAKAEEDEPSACPAIREVRIASQLMGRTLAYATTWILLLIVDYIDPDFVQVSPECGGALALSLVFSLMISGGFSQAITRTGFFYIEVKEPHLAARLCALFVTCGCVVCSVFAVAAFAVGQYFRVFSSSYLLLGCLNFLMLSVLWMACALLSVQRKVWRIPMVFTLGGVVFALLHASGGVFFPIFAGNAASLLCAATMILSSFRTQTNATHVVRETPPLPRVPLLLIMLVPFFLYGCMYFAFLFSDRIAAGSAIPWSSGLSFGIDSQYKRGMDLALLVFLLISAVVEYMADRFIRHWFQLAERPVNVAAELQHSYRRSMATVFSIGVFLPLAAWFLLRHLESRVLVTAVLGSVGYLFLGGALFNLIVLLSIDRADRTLACLAIALACNLISGYVLSHLFGVHFAVIGLLIGAIILFILSRRSIRVVLADAEYFYAVA